MTAAAPPIRNTAVSMARMLLPGCAYCSTPWHPRRKKELVLQGIPKMIYLDNGPIAKSRVFRTVMAQLGVDIRTHMPKGSDGRRVTARAKSKVERPFSY